MQSRAGQQQQGGGDNSLAVLWILVALFIAGGVIWYVWQPAIVNFVFKVKLFEINVLSLFTTALAKTAASIGGISYQEYNTVPASMLVDLSTNVGNYLRIPVSIILFVLASIIYVSNAILPYKKTYTMQRLIDEELTNWPSINPISQLDLIAEPLEKGPWAMSLTPMAFAKKNNLLKEERTMSDYGTLQRVTASLLRNESHRVFAMQLGKYWTGPQALPIHIQALFAIFCARSAGDRAGSLRLMKQINLSTTHGKLDFSGTRELIRKNLTNSNKPVLRVMAQHAFIYTVMASMLDLARKDGVLATSEFLWLRPIDRQFWYIMNSVGRKTPFAEAAGPFAHWTAELRYGQPIRVPMVEEAVNALEVAVKEVLYKPEEG